MDILNQLRELIFRLNRDDVTTVQSLLKRITGDQIATIMLTRLLYWLPKSQTGWVFKSWRDWEAECGLTRAQVKRVHGSGLLEAVGVQRELRKARGAPTVHYRVDLDLLFEKIADQLGIAVDDIAGAGRDRPEPLSDNSPIDTTTSAQTVCPKSPNGLAQNRPIHNREKHTRQTNRDRHHKTTTACCGC